MKLSHDTLTQALTKLLRPLARILLQQGISYDAAAELLKRSYVDVADKEFMLTGKKQTVSRISTLTGLSRKEVNKIKEEPKLNLSDLNQQYNRAARVISGWTKDNDFLNNKGKPAELSLTNGKKSFAELVKKYSGDIPVRAITDELIRVGAVKLTKNDSIKLLQKAYIPGKDIDEKLRILGTDVSDLIETIHHNIYKNTLTPFFQRKVAYDAIPEAVLIKLRELITEHAQKYLEELDALLAKYDSDTAKHIEPSGHCRVGLGIYYFEEIPNE